MGHVTERQIKSRQGRKPCRSISVAAAGRVVSPRSVSMRYGQPVPSFFQASCRQFWLRLCAQGSVWPPVRTLSFDSERDVVMVRVGHAAGLFLAAIVGEISADTVN